MNRFTQIHKYDLLGEGLWDDLVFASNAINPLGGASDPPRSTVTGLLEFETNKDQVIAGAFEMPHLWVEESYIQPHLHLRCLASDLGHNSRWQLEYDRCNPTGEWESVYGSYAHSEIITVPNPGNVNKGIIAAWADIDMTGYKISAGVAWKITRLGSGDVLDNDAGSIALVFWDIHWQKNRLGSIGKFHV